MAVLSKEAREILVVALANRKRAEEVADAIDAAQNASQAQAANVAELGATTDLSAVAGTYAIPAEPTGAEVDATVQALADEVEARMDASEAKIDELIAALVAAGLMAAP